LLLLLPLTWCTYLKRKMFTRLVRLLLLQNGNTPLHLAAFKGFKEVVGQLLAAGAAVNVANEVSPTPQARLVESGTRMACASNG
jgi:hypothetical protein